MSLKWDAAHSIRLPPFLTTGTPVIRSFPPACCQAVPASHFTNAQKELKTYHFILVAAHPTQVGDQGVSELRRGVYPQYPAAPATFI
jgi:hypothetical protein